MKIRIISTPPGEAPEYIRKAWIGLEIPIPPQFEGRRRGLGFGVLSGPKTKLGSLFSMLLGQAKREDGYIVEALAAVELLERNSWEAADWWRQNVSHLMKPGMHFIFDAAACEEIE